MPRGNHRNHSVKGNARKRLLRGETHGMAVLLSDHSLSIKPLNARDDDGEDVYLVPTEALERLAAFLGVADPALDPPGQTLGQRRRTLVHAIRREEKRLAKCPRTERWNESPARRRQKEEDT